MRVAYVCALGVSRELVRYVAGLLAAGRRRRGTRRGTRRLTPFRQARFALAWFRDRYGIERLGAGFGLSWATAYRYLDEALCVLSDRAPGLRQALERATRGRVPYLILDGTVIAYDRPAGTTISVKGKEIDSWYGGKTHDLGGNARALMDPRGIPRWISDVLPGRLNDPNVAREPVLAILWPCTATMPVPADGGYNGAGRGVLAPVPQRTYEIPLHADQRIRNKFLKRRRHVGERGLAPLAERRKALRHETTSPSRITDLTRAALAPTHFEHGPIS
jgi:hypothetical protein